MVLIEQLINQGIIRSPALVRAFRKISRPDFLTAEMRAYAEDDTPLPIGWGQTNSQPYTVAFMLELLRPKTNDKVLDIGFGSGWTTALLATVVGKKGRVWAMELIKPVFQFGQQNLEKYQFANIELLCADGSVGLKKEAPFDKILVSASADKLPTILLGQLKTNGRLVIPIENSVWLFIKKSPTKFIRREFPGFVFVPLVSA